MKDSERVCFSGDAVHREEAAESPVSFTMHFRHNELISAVCLTTFDPCRYVLIDTPGQIEVFTWSASGTIITESLVDPLTFCFSLLFTLLRGRNNIFSVCVSGVFFSLCRDLCDGHVPQR